MKPFHIISILLPLILLCHLVTPVSADEEICTVPAVPEITIDDAVEAYKTGKIEEALQIYRYISEESNDPRIAGISSFMAGQIMGQIMVEGAEEYLENAYYSYPLIGDYALFRLAGVYESKGENDMAANLYKTIYESYPDSVLKKRSLLKAADSYLVSGKIQDARGAYNAYISMYPDDKSVPSALYGIGMSYLSDNTTTLAFDYFKRIWIDYPANPISWSAKEKINRLREKGLELPLLTPIDTYRRAERLYEAGLYSDALTEYKRFLSHRNDVPRAEKKVAHFKIGMSNYNLRRSEEAEDAFESFLNNYPGHLKAPDALYWLGRTYLREDKEDAFIKAGKGYLKQYKDEVRRPEVLYRLGVFYAGKRKVKIAAAYFDRVMKEYPHSSFAPDSQWAKGWLLYKEGALKKSLSIFDNIIKQKKGSTYIPQALYWKAKVSETMDDHQGMEKSLCRLCSDYGGSFYCLFARYLYSITCVSSIGMEISGAPPLPLRGTKENENSLPFKGRDRVGMGLFAGGITNDYKMGAPEDDQDVRIKILLYLGLKEEAIEEIRWLQQRIIMDREKAIALASVLSSMEEYNMALNILYSNFSRDVLYNSRSMDMRVWRLIYPTGYSSEINRYAGENSVDPFLLYALIREESWFNRHAVSSAGAVGLMQLMPQTASSIAKDSYAGRDSLFDPEINISLGTRFFSDLLGRFDGNIILAVAGYNAGPAAVSRWLKERDGFELDKFIEDIPYRETRDYVKKVFRSYMEYKGDLAPFISK